MRRPALGRWCRIAALALLAALGACAPAPLADGIALRIEVARDEVDFGCAFPLRVVRAWRDDLVAPAWDEAALAPLDLRLRDVRTRRRGGVVEETRRYDAFAFVPGEVALDGVTFTARARTDDVAHVATAAPLRLRVRSSLPPDDPGDAELPAGPLPEPAPGPPLAVLVAGALLAGAVVGRVAARPRAPRPAAAADPDARTLELLARLRADDARGALSSDDLAVALTALVRDWVDARFALPATRRSTERLLAEPATAARLGASAREPLGALLGACDQVKFARGTADAAQRVRWLDAAETLVRASHLRSAP